MQRIGNRAGTTTRIRTASPAGVDAADIRAWIALEAQALQPNAYMSPHFVLPALRHLECPEGTRILFVERASAGATQTIAVAVVYRRAATRLVPAPHHALYESRHSYLGAPLLHREFAAEAADALFNELARHRWTAAGLVMPSVDPDGPLLPALTDVWRSHGLALQTSFDRQRSTLVTSQAGLNSLRMRKKYKDLERCRRRLKEQGQLQWLLHRKGVNDEIIEAFLRLEHSGWKGQHRTSLRSRPADESFFREMTLAFAHEERAFFTELRLNGRPIALNSHYISAREGFAFKIGWEEAFRPYCVSMLNDAELVIQAPEVCSDLTIIDSGCVHTSYMDTLWPSRRSLVTAFLPYSPVGQMAWQAAQKLRSMRRWARTWAAAWRPKLPPRRPARPSHPDTRSPARGDVADGLARKSR